MRRSSDSSRTRGGTEDGEGEEGEEDEGEDQGNQRDPNKVEWEDDDPHNPQNW